MKYPKLGALVYATRSASRGTDVTARRVSWISLALASFSLAVSIAIAIAGELRARAAEHRQFLSETYGNYLDTDRIELDHPEIAHELVVADEYAEELKRVRSAFAGVTPEEKARLRLREEAAAFYVFSSFARLVQAQKTPAWS